MINREPQVIKNRGPVVNGKDGECRDIIPSAGSYKGRSVFWDEALFWDNCGLERFMIRSFHCRKPRPVHVVMYLWLFLVFQKQVSKSRNPNTRLPCI